MVIYQGGGLQVCQLQGPILQTGIYGQYKWGGEVQIGGEELHNVGVDIVVLRNNVLGSKKK